MVTCLQHLNKIYYNSTQKKDAKTYPPVCVHSAELRDSTLVNSFRVSAPKFRCMHLMKHFSVF